MSLSSLPDLCLVAILDRIPLLDLLSTVSLVCYRWNNLKPEACHRRTTLTIVQKQENMNKLEQKDNPYNFVINPQTNKPYHNLVQVKANIQNCTLILPKLTQTNCERVAELFPNLKKFSIYQQIDLLAMLEPMIFHINFLLDKWTQTLKTFVFKYHTNKHFLEISKGISKFNCIKNTIERIFNSLLMQIDSMSHLEVLELILLVGYGTNIEIQLPALTQLKRFAFHGVGFSNKTAFSFGPPEKTKLQDVHLYWLNYDQLFGLPPHTSSSVKSFHLFGWIDIEKLDLLCTRFASLTSLLVFAESRQVSMEPMVKSLARLPNLMHLTLSAYTDPLNADKCSIQLLSVKILTIQFVYFKNHQHIERLCVPKIFPNVEVVRLLYRGFNCSVCVNESFDKEKCLTLLTEPLNQCAKVPKIIEQKGNGLDIFNIVEL